MQVIFSVVDLDKSDKYPNNFVCLLPKQINFRLKKQTKFVERFEKKSTIIAKELLIKLLRSEKDMEIRKAIKKRLRILDSRSVVTFRCCFCGSSFEPDEEKFKSYRICPDCKQSIYNVQ
jgi:predicted Zn-ribbon and HTH transcriptional regulator